MGYQPPPQDKLFCYGVNLDRRVRRNHPLQRIEAIPAPGFTCYDSTEPPLACPGSVRLVDCLPVRELWD